MLDLGDDVLIAIGSVSAEWAALEFYMSRATHSCCNNHGNPLPKLSGWSFGQRRDAFIEAFEGKNVAPDARQRALDLAHRIRAAENKRHKIIHGIWQMRPLTTVMKKSSARPAIRSSHC
jgi:hypothetical protein